MSSNIEGRIDRLAQRIAPGIDPQAVADIEAELRRIIGEAERNGSDWRGVVRKAATEAGADPELLVAEFEGMLVYGVRGPEGNVVNVIHGVNPESLT